MNQASVPRPGIDLSIIVVNWNSVDYLVNCIASIHRHTRDVKYEIIVVDNASPEGRLEILEQRFPEAKIIRNNKNIGFAGANNEGFQQSSGSYLLFLNPDTELKGPAVELLLEHTKALPDAGIVGCTLLNTDLSVSTTSIQKFPTIWNQILSIEYLRNRWPGCPMWALSPLVSRSAKPVKVEVIPGACMLLKRAVFMEAGLFSDDYFMYAEDIDLNHKVAQLGLSNYYVSQASIIHHGGKSSSQRPVNQWATIMKHKAMLQLFTKTRGHLYGLIYRTAMGVSAVARLVLLAVSVPFANRDTLRSASGKWSAILKWSLGLHSFVLQER